MPVMRDRKSNQVMSPSSQPSSLPSAPISLCVFACTPSGTPIVDAEVRLSGSSQIARTRNDGIAYVTLTEAEFKALLLDDRVIAAPTASDPRATATIKTGGATFSIEKAGYGPMPDPGGSVVVGPVTVTTVVWSNTCDFGDGTPMVDRLRLKEMSNGRSVVVLRRVLVAPLALQGVGNGQEHPDIPVRHLTIDEAHDELMYHHDHAHITLRPRSQYTQQPDGTLARPSRRHPGLANVPGEDPNENVLVETQPTICGVTFIALINLVSATGFTWAPLTHLVLNFRHAVALVRLCRLLYAMGYRYLYTSGVNADDNRNDCHGWGRAIDIGGFATEMPQPRDPNQKQRLSDQRQGRDFIVLFDWGRVHMWNGATTTGPVTGWERLLRIDDEYDYVANAANRLLKYRLFPPDRFKVNGRDLDAVNDAVRITHLVTASTLFRDIYDFATEQYSDRTGRLGPPPPGAAETATPIDSHSPSLIFHPDYAYWNRRRSDLREARRNEPDPVKKAELQRQIDSVKNDRDPHNNHYHIQLGRTNAPRPVIR